MPSLLTRVGIDLSQFASGMQQIRAMAAQASASVAQGWQQANAAAATHQTQLRSIALSMGSVTVAAGAMKAAVAGAAIAQESAFAGIRKTVNESEYALRQLQGTLTAMANRIPVPFTDLARIGELAGQLGVRGTENISKFIETIARLEVSTNLTGEAAATSFARIANIMQEPIKNVDRMGAVVVELGNNFATTERDIVEFSERIASAGRVAGLTTANVMAIGAAVSSVGVEAEAGGTAVQKMLIAITRSVASADEKLEHFAKLANTAPDAFAKLFKAQPIEAFTRVIEGLGRAGDAAFSFIDDIMGNEARFTRVMLSLASGGDLLRRAVEKATTAWAENRALLEESEKRFATTASAIQTLWNQVTNLAAGIGEHLLPGLKSTSFALGTVVQAFAQLPDAVQGAIAVVGVGAVGTLTLTASLATMAALLPSVTAGLALIGTTLGGLAAAAGGSLVVLAAVATTLGLAAQNAGLFVKDAEVLEFRASQIAVEMRNLQAATHIPEGEKQSMLAKLRAELAEIEAVLQRQSLQRMQDQLRKTGRAGEEMSQALGKEQLEDFTKLVRMVNEQGLSPLEIKVAQLRDKFADQAKTMGVHKAAFEALARVAVDFVENEERQKAAFQETRDAAKDYVKILDLMSESLQPATERTKNLLDEVQPLGSSLHLSKIKDLEQALNDLDMTFRGMGHSPIEFTSTLSKQADTFAAFGLRVSDTSQVLAGMSLQVGLLNTELTVEEQRTKAITEALRGEMEALHLLGNEEDELKRKEELYIKARDEIGKALARERATFGLLGVEAEKQRVAIDVLEKSYAKATPTERIWVDQLAQERIETKLLADASLLRAAGLDELTAKTRAASAIQVEEQQRVLQARLKNIQTLNNAEREAAAVRARIMMEEAQGRGAVVDFIRGSIGSIAATWETVWQAADNLFKGVFQSISRGLSDFVFDAVTGAKDVGSAFADMGKAMLRAITDFLASAAVGIFLRFLAQLLGVNSGGLTIGVGGGGGGGGGIGGSIVGGGLGAGTLGVGLIEKAWKIVTGDLTGTTTGNVAEVVAGSGTTTTTFSDILRSGTGAYGGFNIGDYTVPDTFTDFYFGASGGWVPGVGRGDRVPAMLEPGEFVVNREAATRHFSALASVNRYGGPIRQEGGVGHAEFGGLVEGAAGLASVGGGGFNLFQQSQGGDAGGAIMSGIQVIKGMAQAIKALAPEQAAQFMEMLGVSGSAVSGLAAVAGIAGALAGLYGIYQGVLTGGGMGAAQAALGAYGAVGGTALAASSGLFGTAAAGVGSTVGAALIPFAPLIAVGAIGMMNAMHKEQERVINQTKESKRIRDEFGEALPRLEHAAGIASHLDLLKGMSSDQQVSELLAAFPIMQAGIATLSPISKMLGTRGTGGAASLIKPIPDDTIQAMAEQLQPMIAAAVIGYMRVADALAARGVRVPTSAGSNEDFLGLVNQLAGLGGLHVVPGFDIYDLVTKNQALYAHAAPGRLEKSAVELFTALNPDFKNSDLYRLGLALPGIALPAGMTQAQLDAIALTHGQGREVGMQISLIDILSRSGVGGQMPFGAERVIDKLIEDKDLGGLIRFIGNPTGYMAALGELQPGLVAQLWGPSGSENGGGFQAGGWVGGSGDGDRMMILAEPGEFVVNRRSAAMHADELEVLNSGRGGGGGGITVIVNVQGDVTDPDRMGEVLARKVSDVLKERERRSYGAGDPRRG